MTKNLYEKPTITVVMLQQRSQLLEGSGVRAERKSYGQATVEDWE